MNPMNRLIERLFREAPKMTDASGAVDHTQAPAVQCHVILRGCPQPFLGVASLDTETGLMKMLIPSVVQDDERAGGKRPALLEFYFDVDDVQAIMVEREVKQAERSSLIIA